MVAGDQAQIQGLEIQHTIAPTTMLGRKDQTLWLAKCSSTAEVHAGRRQDLQFHDDVMTNGKVVKPTKLLEPKGILNMITMKVGLGINAPTF